MKTLAALTLVVVVTGAPAINAQADPMEDICRVRAEKGSGYSGSRPGLTRQVGNTQFRLSGSVAVGGSRSSGPAVGGAPAFAGQASSERREDKAESKYRRIYDSCMRGR